MMQVGKVLKRIGSDALSLERARYSRAQREAEQFEALARKIVSPEAAALMASQLLARTPKPEKSEPFVMLTPSQNAAVARWIFNNSKRPQAASLLWAELFTALHPSTGEIMLSREELAQRLGILPRDLSSIMTELASIGAIIREKHGRTVRYVMSPHIATHQTGEKLVEARAKAPKLRLVKGAAQDGHTALEQAGQMRLID